MARASPRGSARRPTCSAPASSCELTRLYPDISGVLPAYGWSMPVAQSHDGGLYAGPHRNFPHQLFALGTGHDPARAYLASRVLLRHVTGETTPDDEHLGFARSL